MKATPHLRFTLHDPGASPPPSPPPPTITVACASSDLRTVDEHFGSATRMVVYRVGPRQSELVEVLQFVQPSLPPRTSSAAALEAEGETGHEGRLPAKVQALAGCTAAVCTAAGASAVRQLAARGIHPLRVEPGTPIAHVLEQLSAEVAAPREPWLVRALERAAQPRDADRFQRFAEQPWTG